MIDEKMLKELGFEKNDSCFIRQEDTIPTLEYRIKLADESDKIYISAWSQVICDPDIIDRVITDLNKSQIHFVYSRSGSYIVAQNAYCIEPSSRERIFNLISSLLTEIGSALESTINLIREIAYDAI